MTALTILSIVPGLLFILLIVRRMRAGRRAEQPAGSWSPVDTGPFAGTGYDAGPGGGADAGCGSDGGGGCS